MSHKIAQLVSQIVGSDKLEACLSLCEITNISDIRNVNEATLANMEKYIRKTCCALPVSERRQFIDDEIVNNPDKFMFPPGLSQRILNAAEKTSKLFQSMPVTDTAISAISHSISRNSTLPSTRVSIKLLETVLNCNRDYRLDTALAITNSVPQPQPTPATAVIADKPTLSLTSRTIESTDQNNNDNSSMDCQDIAMDPLRHSHLNPPSIEPLSLPTPSPVTKLAERSSAKLVESLVAEFLPQTSTKLAIKAEPIVVDDVIEQIDDPVDPPMSHTERVRIKSESTMVATENNQLVLVTSANRPKIDRRESRRVSGPHNIDYYYTKVVADGEKFFIDCNLIPKVDFDVELNIRGKVDTQKCAHFVCHRCQSTLKREKKLKFYLTERGAIINSNIINHLKIHYVLK